MAGYKGTERRRRQRTKLVTFCPATFQLQGHAHRALMRDVTELGAGFEIDGDDAECNLQVDTTIEYSVKTPYGTSVCEGRTAWARHLDDRFCWGVEFTRISDDNQDPLRCMMDSPF